MPDRSMLIVDSHLDLGFSAIQINRDLTQPAATVRTHDSEPIMLMAMHLLTDYLHLQGLIRESPWIVLLVACLIGVIPESGPHLVFLTLYVKGAVPLSILWASSIVQDGHGMLPMLAHSRRAFVQVKMINLAIGLAVGAAGLFIGV